MKVRIISTEEIDGKELSIEKIFRGEITSSIKRHFKKNLSQYVSFLNGFGNIKFNVIDLETGEVLCYGKFICNCFSGRNILIINN